MDIHAYAQHTGRSMFVPADTLKAGMALDIGTAMHRAMEQALTMGKFKAKLRTGPVHARNRTRSTKALAGSRRNKRHPIARVTHDSDWVNLSFEYRSAPNHAARFQDIRTMFPLAPGQSVPVKRWA